MFAHTNYIVMSSSKNRHISMLFRKHHNKIRNEEFCNVNGIPDVTLYTESVYHKVGSLIVMYGF